MGQMPQWFAKTPEMVQSDQFFSLGNDGESGLAGRYQKALERLQATDYYRQSQVLGGRSAHFDQDWINYQYPSVKTVGGRFWPQIPSDKVVRLLRHGTMLAIHKALGARLAPTLQTLGITSIANMSVDDYIARLFAPERKNKVETEKVLPLATSWNCVAPPGSDFFEVDALRGASVVEFAIATPRPLGTGLAMPLIDELDAEGREPEEET